MSGDIEERLARLERQDRYFKFYGLIGIVLFAATLVFVLTDRRTKAGEVIKAGGFEVIDSKGRRCAVLGLTDKDQPYLALDGSDNSRHILLSIRPDGPPFMVMGDMNTVQHLSLYGPTPKSGGSIDFTWDAKHVAEMLVTTDGIPSLILRDKDGKTLWKAP